MKKRRKKREGEEGGGAKSASFRPSSKGQFVKCPWQQGIARTSHLSLSQTLLPCHSLHSNWFKLGTTGQAR